jgi:16S rRNA (cytosine1402-N4)-methyltransferase
MHNQMETPGLSHVPVLLQQVLSFVPENAEGRFLDVTAGGGGHFFAVFGIRPSWNGECWDRDPRAEARLRQALDGHVVEKRAQFTRKTFSDAPDDKNSRFDFILADIGVSSFQLDDPTSGMSLHAESPPDFRMDTENGLSFWDWLEKTKEEELADVLFHYGEEPRARKLAKAMKQWGPNEAPSAKALADKIAATLAYGTHSRRHPATRAFQALRIAINDELGELRSFLEWAPEYLKPGGRLAVISFHSLEDRIVKRTFRSLADERDFGILTKRPLEASDEESSANPRARSAKLRVIEKLPEGVSGTGQGEDRDDD